MRSLRHVACIWIWVVLIWVIWGSMNKIEDTKVSYPIRLIPRALTVVIEGGMTAVVKEGLPLVHGVEMGWQVPEL